MDKVCTKCNQTKPETEFYVQRGIRIARCKKCVNAANQSWRHANPERNKETSRLWVKNNPDRVNAAQKRWKAKNPGLANERARAWYRSNLPRHRACNRARDRKLKDAVFQAYGGYRCACCGETIKEFLSIDHINNDGSKHRQQIFGDKAKGRFFTGRKFYEWLIHNNFPKGFQVLCMNCNWAKGKNPDHICPHKLYISEPSTTIPQGSRLQANGSPSAEPLSGFHYIN